jgi:uncharacterized protein (DUF2147 family)
MLPHHAQEENSSMRILSSIALSLLLAGAAHAAGPDPMGQWARGDGNAKVKIVKCGTSICAINTWIKPGTPSEKAGDKLVMTVQPTSESTLSGTAFDPQRDMSYKISLTVGGDAMTTKGCILGGLLCKGVDWTRIK